MQKTVLTVLMVTLIGLALGLSACGRVSRPMTPDGSEYPKSYSVKP